MNDRFVKRACRGLAKSVLPAALLSIGLAAHAEDTQSKSKAQYAKEIGASERVNYSGKLRMLSQRVVATSCNYAAGIDPEASGAAMRDAQDEFNLIVEALEFGNPDLGIHGEEKRRKTQARIGQLRDEWAPVSAGLDSIADGQASSDQVGAVAEMSAPLLEMAKLLVSDLSAQYSDPNAMLQANAMLVDISGRQRMLTQRMSKNFCLLASGVGGDTAKAELEATAGLFEASLVALSGGMLNAGINPPPNEQIAEGLDIVMTDWAELKPAVEAALSGAEFDKETRAAVFHGMNRMTADMNKVVGMYSDASKLGS